MKDWQKNWAWKISGLPAAAVATATLINAVKDGTIKFDDLIMLNITGGGEEKFKAENELYYINPEIVFDINPDEKKLRNKYFHFF